MVDGLVMRLCMVAVNEHTRLKDQIEELKHSLEQAQIHRKRKQEYDVIAEKINALPSRDDLTQYVPPLLERRLS